jgi:hypothetical protein
MAVWIGQGDALLILSRPDQPCSVSASFVVKFIFLQGNVHVTQQYSFCRPLSLLQVVCTPAEYIVADLFFRASHKKHQDFVARRSFGSTVENVDKPVRS